MNELFYISIVYYNLYLFSNSIYVIIIIISLSIYLNFELKSKNNIYNFSYIFLPEKFKGKFQEYKKFFEGYICIYMNHIQSYNVK